MADAVSTNVVLTTPKTYVVHLTNISDATGETNVVKIDKSTLLAERTQSGVAQAEPVSVDIEFVRWNIQGITVVKLSWDHTTDDTALALSGTGYDDFTGRDGAFRDIGRIGGLKDPRSAGGTGDLLLTTVGATSGGSYDITIGVHLANV